MFDKRNKGISTIFVGNYVSGQPMRDAVSNGDDVVLHMEGESILVKNVKALGASRFKGTIYGFEPSHVIEYQGMKLDDEVEFEEQHIISCSEK